MTVHYAGVALEVRGHVRQRCAWCGAKLIDQNLANVAIQVETPDESVEFATWELGALVAVDGGMSHTVNMELNEDGSPKAPDGSCLALDPAVTA